MFTRDFELPAVPTFIAIFLLTIPITWVAETILDAPGYQPPTEVIYDQATWEASIANPRPVD